MAKPMPAEQAVVMPRAFAARVLAFLTGGLSGNITLHVKAGVIRGARIEEVVQNSVDIPPQRD